MQRSESTQADVSCSSQNIADKIGVVIRSSISTFLALVATSIVLALPAKAQAKPSTLRFEDYHVTEIFRGTPVAPILVTADQRLFRTRIWEGVAKGLGVLRDGREQAGPNFAGHYIVVTCVWLALRNDGYC